MKKKFLLLILILFLTSCANKDAVSFKKEYEELNGKENANGKVYRNVSVPKNNPIKIVNASDIVDKIEKKDTFYVYFGSSLCPWCRSVIEKAMEVANANGIEEVYYVDFWDKDGKELYRDKYTIDDNGNLVKDIEGSEEYYKLLSQLDSVLEEYTIENKDGEEIDVNEKRIYLPNFIYIAKGKPIRMTTGISELQTGSRDELTKEILLDEEKKFDDFFINVCDESC